MTDSSKAERRRNLRYKRPALASLGYESLITELWEIRETCNDIHWFVDQGDETLLNALDGDEEAEWEFRMAFSDLEAKADRISDMVDEWRRWDEDEFGRTYNDCTVALIGNRYKTIGFDMLEEDYFALTSYQQDIAHTEAGKRFMRKTKAEMLSEIGQCFGVLIAFLDLRQQYDYLKATFDILRDENTSMLKIIKEIDAAYDEMQTAEPWTKAGKEAIERFDRLLANLPERAWVE